MGVRLVRGLLRSSNDEDDDDNDDDDDDDDGNGSDERCDSGTDSGSRRDSGSDALHPAEGRSDWRRNPHRRVRDDILPRYTALGALSEKATPTAGEEAEDTHRQAQ